MATAQRALRDINRETTLIGVAADGSNVPIQAEIDSVTGRLLVDAKISSNAISSLVPVAFDGIKLSNYSGNNAQTVQYYVGGTAAGTIVATLTITYDGSGNILTVNRT